MTDKVSYLDGSLGVTEKIKKAMFDAARQFVYIGFLLWEVQEYGYYKEHGYKDVYDYAEQELNFKRTSTKNFIAVCKEFSKSEDKKLGPYAVSKGQEISMTLAGGYENFKYSQLVEMVALSPAQRKEVTPDMTVKQIRQMKQQAAEELKADNYTIPEVLEAPPAAAEGAETELLEAQIMRGQTSVQEIHYTAWVDLEEEPPFIEDDYLVTIIWKPESKRKKFKPKIEVSHYDLKNEKFDRTGVTAWAELPKPYQV